MHSRAEITLKLFLVTCILIAGFVTGVIAPRNLKTVPTSGEIARAPPPGDHFTVFYGDIFGLANSDGSPTQKAHDIANCGVDVLITGAWGGCYYGAYKRGIKNLTPQVVDLLHSKGVKVIGHICNTGGPPYPSWWKLHTFYEEEDGSNYGGQFQGESTREQVDAIFDLCSAIDGVSDGECYYMSGSDTDLALDFFGEYYSYVKRTYPGKEVWFNTGAAYTERAVMDVCDVVGLENYGELFATRPDAWIDEFPSHRFYDVPANSNSWSLSEAIQAVEYHWELGFGGSGCKPAFSHWYELFENFKDDAQVQVG